MKRMISLIASLSLTLLSAGPAVPSAAAQTVSARVSGRGPVAPVTALPGLTPGSVSAPLVQPGLLASPDLYVFRPALEAAPGIVPAAARLDAARPAGLPAAPALPSAAPAGDSRAVLPRVLAASDGEATPFAESLQRLQAPAPEYKDMDAGASRSAAEADFQARLQGGAVQAAGAELPDVELLVSAEEGSGLRVSKTVYPSYLSPKASVRDVELAMTPQLQGFKISQQTLRNHSATAVGSVAQINTVVIRVPGANAAGLMDELKAKGLTVQVGRTFRLPKPMETEPTAKTVSLKQMGAIIGADKLQEELKKVLGVPTPPQAPPQKVSSVSRAMAWVGRTVRRVLFGAVENPVLPWAILDSWSAVEHPFLKGRFLKSVANGDDGESHGTHTAGTVVGTDIYNYHGRNYNIFPNGNATEGDILFKLNMAQEDGALATTNSWGDGAGNPEGAIEKLFVKSAQAGMHHSISAGNSGYYGKNTVGGPAIAVAVADLVINGKTVGSVKRIKAIAASDADKKTAAFSSRGPGSETTSSNPDQYKDYPQKPDESGVGVNLVAPVPQGTVVPELGGPGASMSGTSMSNPGVFGGFMLLTRSILVLLKDVLPVLPQAQLTQFAMDLARYSMTQTAEKVAPADEVGDGFVNVWAAYQYAAQVLKDNLPPPSKVRAKFHSLMRGLFGFAPASR